jgi:hypothetical protein
MDPNVGFDRLVNVISVPEMANDEEATLPPVIHDFTFDLAKKFHSLSRNAVRKKRLDRPSTHLGCVLTSKIYPREKFLSTGLTGPGFIPVPLSRLSGGCENGLIDQKFGGCQIRQTGKFSFSPGILPFGSRHI